MAVTPSDVRRLPGTADDTATVSSTVVGDPAYDLISRRRANLERLARLEYENRLMRAALDVIACWNVGQASSLAASALRLTGPHSAQDVEATAEATDA